MITSVASFPLSLKVEMIRPLLSCQMKHDSDRGEIDGQRPFIRNL